MNEVNSVWKLIVDLASKEGITEIVINNKDSVFVERAGKFIQLKVDLKEEDLMPFIQDVAKYNDKTFSEEYPILDGNLEDGSRINVIGTPYSHKTPSITIRKYLKQIKSFDTNPSVFGLSPKWVEFLKALVQSRMNIVVSGGTGVGKTTFLNLMLNELSPMERVITIEDTLELSFKVPNLVRLEAGNRNLASKVALTARDLVKNTLRMRPDRIIIGEVRGGELFDLLQAMNTGHDGSMTSVHANNTGECLSRMETLFLLSGYEIPYHVIRKQISSAVDFVIQISRDRDGNRIISSISEITGMERDVILLQHIATNEEGMLKPTRMSPKNMPRISEKGGIPIDFFDSF